MLKKILLVAAMTAPLAMCSPVAKACSTSKNARANGQLCSCIGQVADSTLTSSDQRKAAKFFADPHRAQEMRTSKSASDKAFWKRYRHFTARAEQRCG